MKGYMLSLAAFTAVIFISIYTYADDITLTSITPSGSAGEWASCTNAGHEDSIYAVKAGTASNTSGVVVGKNNPAGYNSMMQVFPSDKQRYGIYTQLAAPSIPGDPSGQSLWLISGVASQVYGGGVTGFLGTEYSMRDVNTSGTSVYHNFNTGVMSQTSGSVGTDDLAGLFMGNVIIMPGLAGPGDISENGGLYIGNPSMAANGNKMWWRNLGSASGCYRLVVNGKAAKFDGTTWANLSDARLKDIKGKYTYGLPEIDKLDVVRFKYKKNNKLGLPSDKEMVGLVAQNVQSVIPEAVEKGPDGYLQLNADPVIWAMLNSIKELKAENSGLKKRIEILEAKK